jgi:DNA polymerase III epsilon subunit-like protein
MGRINELIGFNSNQFDLPFLVRRSWKHRVPVPPGIRRGRYWSEQMIDLREHWQLGDRQARGSLDAIAKHLGIGAKNGSGSDFARLWVNDRPKAVEYLRNDLQLAAGVARALGII